MRHSPHTLGRATELRDLRDPAIDENCAALVLQTFTTPEGTETGVLVHQDSRVAPNVQFAELAGPVGRDTHIGRGSIVYGALKAQVRIGENVVIGPHTRLGSYALDESIGDIRVQTRARTEANVRVFSPETGHVTIIGADALLGSGCIIGSPAKPATSTNSDKIAHGEGVRIGRKAVLAPHTIVEPGATVGTGAQIGRGYRLVRGVAIPAGTIIPDNPELKGKPTPITKDWLQRYRRRAGLALN